MEAGKEVIGDRRSSNADRSPVGARSTTSSTADDRRSRVDGWMPLAEDDPAFGQAVAAADDILQNQTETFAAGDYEADRRLLDKGGERCPKIGDSLDFFAFFHEPHYALVEVQPVVPQHDRAGPGAAARPMVDPVAAADVRAHGARPRHPPPAGGRHLTIGVGAHLRACAAACSTAVSSCVDANLRARRRRRARRPVGPRRCRRWASTSRSSLLLVLAVALRRAQLRRRRGSSRRKRPDGGQGGARTSAASCPAEEPPERFPVSFYLVAMLFIMFDIEIIFLYPYAVSPRDARRRTGSGRSSSFSVVFFLAFVYVVAKGGLDWGPLRAAAAGSTRVGLGRAHRRDHHPPGRARRPRGERGGGLMGLVQRRRATTGSAGLDHNFITGKLEDLVNWARARSTWPAHVRSGLLRHRDDGHRRPPTTTSPASAWRSSGPRPARPTS